VAAFPAGFLVDWRGRREAIFWSAFVTLIGAILQCSAVNVAMFIAARFIIGMGLGIAATVTPIYVAETAPPKYRAFALGLYYSCWGVGTMVASGICYRVSQPSIAAAYWLIGHRLSISIAHGPGGFPAWYRQPRVSPACLSCSLSLSLPDGLLLMIAMKKLLRYWLSSTHMETRQTLL
jgi:MFS family permease